MGVVVTQYFCSLIFQLSVHVFVSDARLFSQSYLGIEGRRVRLFGRTTVGDCACILSYDGRADHVLNVNNRILVHYSELPLSLPT